MKKFNFILSLYFIPFDIVVSFEQTDKELLEFLNILGHSNAECSELFNMSELTRGRCILLNSNYIVMRFVYQSKMCDMIDVISHESSHATIFIFDKLNQRLEVGINDEFFSYIQSYIVKEIYKKIEK